MMPWVIFVFFFQAEDGIRDVAVTGVQTCALPISLRAERAHLRLSYDWSGFAGIDQESFGHRSGMERNERLGLRQTTACRASSRPPLRLSSRKQFPRPPANSRSPCCRGLILIVKGCEANAAIGVGCPHLFRNRRCSCGSCNIASTRLVFRSSLAFCFLLRLSRKAPPKTFRPYWGSKYSRPVPLCCR